MNVATWTDLIIERVLRLEPCVLESEMGRLREKVAHDKIKVDSDAGLLTLCHTFQTKAGDSAYRNAPSNNGGELEVASVTN